MYTNRMTIELGNLTLLDDFYQENWYGAGKKLYNTGSSLKTFNFRRFCIVVVYKIAVPFFFF